MDNDCSSAKFTLSILDDDATLVKNTGKVEIRDAATNKLVWSSEADFGSGDTQKKFNCEDSLTADREYVLIVKNDYQIEVAGGTNTGTKTFVKRNFFTSSEGVTLRVDETETGSLTLTMNRQSFSEAKYFKVRIKSGALYVDYPDEAGSVAEYTRGDEALDINLQQLFEQHYSNVEEYSGMSWSSNIPYEIELYTSSSEESQIWDTDDSGAYLGLSTGKIIKSANILKGKTLKEKPDIGKVNTSLSNEGYYEFSVDVNKDKDKSIKKYVFTVTDQNSGSVIQTLESTSNKVNWYFGDALPTGSYAVSALVTYFDNEKDNIIPAQTAVITSTSTGSPAVAFEPYKRESGVLKDTLGNVVANSDIDAVNATRIWGDIRLMMNARKLDTTKNVSIKITSSDDSTYTREWSIPVSPRTNAAEGTYYIPVKSVGLKANTVYAISIYGTVITEVGTGSTTTQQSSVDFLGSVSVKTTGLNGAVVSSDTSVAGFSIASMVNDINNPDAIAGITLYNGSQYSGINSTVKGSEYYFERSIARAIEVAVYTDTGTKLGTVVKDLYTSDMLLGTAGAVFENPSILTDEEGQFFHGPLVTPSYWTNPVILTKNDFAAAGIDMTNRQGIITLVAEALYDYSYNLRNNFEDYRNHFLSDNAINYNRIRLNILTLTSGGVKTGTLNAATVNLGAKPPQLFAEADTAVTVTEIMNEVGNGTSYTDSTLSADTAIGMKVQSNYPNYNGDTDTISYYCMTMDNFLDFEKNKNSYNTTSRDIIEFYRERKEAGDTSVQTIDFDITLKVSEYTVDTNKGVPALYVIITDEKDKLDRCREPLGVGTYSYHATKDNGKAVFYTDLIDRGDCYVFAITLKSMYGVITEAGVNPEPWEYPYQIDQKVAGQIYYGGKGLQRSKGTELFKATPHVAAYLDHTTINGTNGETEDTAVWNYLVYDPDNTMASADNLIYAGTSEDVINALSNKYLKTDMPTSLLKCEPGGKTTYSDSTWKNDSDIKKIVQKEFGLSSIKDQKLYSFSITIKDNGGALKLANAFSENTPYKIFLGANEFDGERTVKEKVYLDNQKNEAGNQLGSTKHFAVETVTHRFDTLKGKSMTNLNVKVSVVDGSDNINLLITGDTELTQHLVGFYYEIHKGMYYPSHPEVSGFQPYEGSGEVSIPFGEMAVGADAVLKLLAVYDTGVAGVNLRNLNQSNIHDLSARFEQNKEVGMSNKFYAIQKQDVVNYAASEDWNTKLIKFDTGFAGGSVYKVDDNPTLEDKDDYWKTFTVTRYPNRIVYNSPLKFMYNCEGAYTEEKVRPLFKTLAESSVTLASGTTNVTVNPNGTATMEVPAVKPNVTRAVVVRAGLHSADVEVRFTKKSIETLLQGAYGNGKVYFELYEVGTGSAVDTLLPNTMNRYFNVTKNHEEGYANENADPVNGEDESSFLTVTASDTADTTFKIGVRNLEAGKEYRFKMYCQKTKPDGTPEKIYIVNNSSQTTMGQDLSMYMTGAAYLNIGSTTDVSSSPLAAKFVHNSYESRNLEVSYSLSRTNDFYLRYELLDSNGVIRKPDRAEDDWMMKLLGYTIKEPTTFQYFDTQSASWQSCTYQRYKREDGTYFTLQTNIKEDDPLVFAFKDANDILTAGSYKLRIRAIDLYSNGSKEPEYRQDSGNLSSSAPTKTFTVPARKDPSTMITRVSYSRDSSNNDIAIVNLVVYDSGYYMGVIKDGKKEMGVCRIQLLKYKKDATTGVDITDADETIILGDRTMGGLFTKDTAYSFQYPVKEGERYRIVVKGINTKYDPNAETDLYDSDYHSDIKAKLTVGNLHGPQMDNRDGTFDMATEDFVIAVQNGSNLETIDRVQFTLSNMSKNPPVTVNESAAKKFGAADNKGWQEMTISLADAMKTIREAKLESKNLMVLTVQYYNGEQLLATNDFRFTYKGTE